MENQAKEINTGKANYTKYSSRNVWQFSISRNKQLVRILVSEISPSILQSTFRRDNVFNVLYTSEEMEGITSGIYLFLPGSFFQAPLFQNLHRKEDLKHFY